MYHWWKSIVQQIRIRHAKSITTMLDSRWNRQSWWCAPQLNCCLLRTHYTRSRMTFNNETTIIRCTIILTRLIHDERRRQRKYMSQLYVVSYRNAIYFLLRAQPVFWLLSAPLYSCCFSLFFLYIILLMHILWYNDCYQPLDTSTALL